MENTVNSATTLAAACECFCQSVKEWDGEDHLKVALQNMSREMQGTETAQVVFSLLTARATGPDALSLEDKKFAIDLASEMGPDWAQWFYHFAVLITRIA